MSGFSKEFKKGIVLSNPVFVLALSLCPVLAVTDTLDKALGMSGAFALVIIASNLTISLMRMMPIFAYPFLI